MNLIIYIWWKKRLDLHIFTPKFMGFKHPPYLSASKFSSFCFMVQIKWLLVVHEYFVLSNWSKLANSYAPFKFKILCSPLKFSLFKVYLLLYNLVFLVSTLQSWFKISIVFEDSNRSIDWSKIPSPFSLYPQNFRFLGHFLHFWHFIGLLCPKSTLWPCIPQIFSIFENSKIVELYMPLSTPFVVHKLKPKLFLSKLFFLTPQNLDF